MLKRRLKSLFSAKTSPQGDGGPAAARSSLSVASDGSVITTEEKPKNGTAQPLESTTPDPESGAYPNQVIRLGIPFDSPELLAEVRANAAIAKAPRTAELSRFQTAVWDNAQLSTVSLSRWTKENLNEAYIDIELANRLVWLCEVTGRVSREKAESYAKLCASISERLEAVLSQTAAETAPLLLGEETVEAKASAPPRELATETEVVSAVEEVAGTEGEVGSIEVEADRTNALPDMRGESPTIEVHEEDETLFLGKTKVFITRGANSAQIAGLARSLCETQGIRIISTGGSSKGRSTVTLSVDRPLPLLKVLRGIPLVKTASKEGTDIEVSLVT